MNRIYKPDSVLNVCLVAPFPPPYGGIANWAAMISDHYSKHPELRVEIARINTAPPARDLDGRTIFTRVIHGARSVFSSRKELKALIESGNVDVVHVTTSGSLALIRDCILLKLCKRKSVKSVLHIRFGRVPDVIKDNGLEKKLLMCAMRAANKVLVLDSKTEEACLEENVIADSIPNPVNINEIQQGVEKVGDSVVYLGWVIKAKGIEELLAAWELVKTSKRAMQATLTIIGPFDEAYMEYLKSRYSFAGVRIEGELSHVDALEILSRSKIFVFPSYTEGFPNAVVEAMASKCAIIATDVGAIGDMLRDKCGIIVERNPENIANALIELLENDDLSQTLADHARLKAYKMYDLRRVGKLYAEYWGS